MVAVIHEVFYYVRNITSFGVADTVYRGFDNG